ALTAGIVIGEAADWTDGGSGPVVTAGAGVAGSVGLAPGSNIFTWTALPFDWNAADLQGVTISLDLQTDDSGEYDDDRIGWMITDSSTSSSNIFSVQMDPGGDGASGQNIEGYWDGVNGADRRPSIVNLPVLTADTWYRLELTVTKLTATSASLDVTFMELDASGDPSSIVASGSIADTATLGDDEPNAKYFDPSTIWPAYKNMDGGGADNAAFEVITSSDGEEGEVTNIIFFIGDGMGPEQVKAANYYNGGPLSFETFSHQAMMTSAPAGGGTTDSAAAGTALATGFKVSNGVISLAIPGDGSELLTLLEYFDGAYKKSTGLVTTATITHATPASFGAHVDNRNNTSDIAGDYLTQTMPNVLFGGGGAGLSVAATEAAGYVVASSTSEFDALSTTEELISGQFGSSYMPYEYDYLGSEYPYPHLADMVEKALDALDDDPDGFFVMVEGGRIDHAGHDHNLERNVHETLAFSDAVQVAIDWAAGKEDTLILVTADHETGGLFVDEDNGAGEYPTVRWTGSGNHTPVDLPVYAWGVNAELISGTMDNTDMFDVVTNISEVDYTLPVVTVLGDAVVNLETGDTYVDPGVTGEDLVDGDVTDDIVVGGDTVDTGTPGTYVITYSITDTDGNVAEATRTVVVTQRVDLILPVIVRTGWTYVEVTVGGTYTDEGATASDDFDGDITADIAVTGTVNTGTVGTYIISYNVSDSAGNPAVEVIRTVEVVAEAAPAAAEDDDSTCFINSVSANSTQGPYAVTMLILLFGSILACSGGYCGKKSE
ncbi:MAG: alkaline phosphatase, partial [Gammaproteobacteria bacterium]